MKSSNSPTAEQLASYVAEAEEGYDVDMLLARGRGYPGQCYKDREPFNNHERYTVAVQPVIAPGHTSAIAVTRVCGAGQTLQTYVVAHHHGSADSQHATDSFDQALNRHHIVSVNPSSQRAHNILDYLVHGRGTIIVSTRRAVTIMSKIIENIINHYDKPWHDTVVQSISVAVTTLGDNASDLSHDVVSYRLLQNIKQDHDIHALDENSRYVGRFIERNNYPWPTVDFSRFTRDSPSTVVADLMVTFVSQRTITLARVWSLQTQYARGQE